MKLKHIILICLWGLFIAFATFLAMKTSVGRWDFITYHYNAERLMAGETLYGSYTARYDYIYPPLLAQSIAPFTTFLNLDIISIVWHILSLALLGLSVGLVNRTVNDSKQRLMFWLIPLIFIPNYQSMWVGQISMVMLACFTGAWFAYKHDRPFITGGLLALATWLKIYPIFLILYFMWKRDWKVTASAFIVGIGLLGLQIIISDTTTITTYFFKILPGLANNGQMTGLFKNSSILGFTYKLFTETDAIIPLIHSPLLASMSRWILTASVIGGSLLLISRPTQPKQGDTDKARFDLEYGLVVLVSLLFASTLWVSGMPPLILCYQLLLKQKLHRQTRRLVWASFSIVSFYFLYLLAFQVGNKLPALILSMGFYGVFLLWILFMRQLRQLARRNTL
jgi:hypothetical protein